MRLCIFLALGAACAGDDETKDGDPTDTLLPPDTEDPSDTEDTEGSDTAPPTGVFPETNGAIAGSCSADEDGLTYPFSYEIGHWSATVIPITHDGELVSVEYVIRDGTAVQSGVCDATTPHTIELWKGSDGQPEAEPVPFARVEIPAGQALDRYLVHADLPDPEPVSAGEFVILAVQMDATATGPVCIAWCRDSYHGGRNWWSYAESPPYSWGFFPSEGDIEATLYVDAG